MLTRNPLELQENILLLITRAEALGIESLDHAHPVIEELKKEYLLWSAPSDTDKLQYKPNGEFILKLLEPNSDIKLSELKTRFQMAYHLDCIAPSIQSLSLLLSPDCDKLIKDDLVNLWKIDSTPTEPKPSEILHYKKTIFTCFLSNTVNEITQKQHFNHLRIIAQHSGFSNLEYSFLLSRLYISPKVAGLIDGHNKFILVRHGMLKASCLLAIPLTIIATEMVLKVSFESSPLKFWQPILGIIGLHKQAYEFKDHNLDDMRVPLLFTTINLCATAILFKNSESKNMQCLIAGLGLAKTAFDICSTRLLDELTAPSEQAR